VFIDGQAGTTGLQITKRLAQRDDIELLSIDDKARKDNDYRAKMYQRCDVGILCLPDNASKEAVALANGNCKILDASTAHRTNKDWVYGLPELGKEQRRVIAESSKVSNPGCYPQGFILLIKPLIEKGLLPADLGLSLYAISGYSGGGKTLINQRERFDPETIENRNIEAYGLRLEHKHVPEMTMYSGCCSPPIFTPMVGHFYQGMIVNIPLFTKDLLGAYNRKDIENFFVEYYSKEPFVSVVDFFSIENENQEFQNATACNGTNRLEIMVFGHDEQILLSARYDNLGKGASGAAIQNLNLMIGSEETAGLIS